MAALPKAPVQISYAPMRYFPLGPFRMHTLLYMYKIYTYTKYIYIHTHTGGRMRNWRARHCLLAPDERDRERERGKERPALFRVSKLPWKLQGRPETHRARHRAAPAEFRSLRKLPAEQSSGAGRQEVIDIREAPRAYRAWIITRSLRELAGM